MPDELAQSGFVVLRLEIRRQLNQDGAELPAERLDAGEESIQRLMPITQLSLVRDLARELGRKGEAGRRDFGPMRGDVWRRRMIECRVHFHRRKMPRIELAPFRCG